MKFDKNDIKALGINIISNAIFQGIISLIPSVSLTVVLRWLINNFLQMDRYLTYFILFFIFCAIEFLAIYLLKKSIKNIPIIADTNNKEDLDNDKDQLDNKDLLYENLDYYFEDYHKHLTVYKNGNGIIINSFDLIINDINSITQFKRELNIEDAKISADFPSLKIMKNTNLKYRFEKFCFRCKCINNKDLILSVEEKYWTDDSDNDDVSARDNPKDLKWILKMNPSCIEIGKPYHIVYVISIPGMFPIENGFFKETIANKKGTHGNFSSKFIVNHKVKKFIYTISFENELSLYQKPTGKITCINGTKNIPFINDNNIIYDKYIFSAENLAVGSSININWCFKENRKKGGKRNEEEWQGLKQTN